MHDVSEELRRFETTTARLRKMEGIEVKRDQLPVEVVELVTSIIGLGAGVLGMKRPPAARFYRRATANDYGTKTVVVPPNSNGHFACAEPDRVWLRSDLEPRDATLAACTSFGIAGQHFHDATHRCGANDFDEHDASAWSRKWFGLLAGKRRVHFAPAGTTIANAHQVLWGKVRGDDLVCIPGDEVGLWRNCGAFPCVSLQREPM